MQGQQSYGLPLICHPAANPGFPVGTTTVKEWAASTVAGHQHTASPWGVTHRRSANPGDVAGLQHETAVQKRFELKLALREGLVPAMQEMLAMYSAAIISHTSYDRLITRS